MWISPPRVKTAPTPKFRRRASRDSLRSGHRRVSQDGLELKGTGDTYGGDVERRRISREVERRKRRRSRDSIPMPNLDVDEPVGPVRLQTQPNRPRRRSFDLIRPRGEADEADGARSPVEAAAAAAAADFLGRVADDRPPGEM